MELYFVEEEYDKDGQLLKVDVINATLNIIKSHL